MVLCLAMMLSIMVVGAGAAFVDQKDIDTKHQEAVDMCVSLNIITGFENGKFMPNDNVTREQIAKMICVLDNGGKEPQLATGNTFTDVPADRWSNKYIEACAARGVVVGVGGGKFAPAGKVTATQAAKMLLVELGYDDDLQKYSGSNWATQVNIDATKKGYYEDLEDIDVNAPLTREHAAQMIWNALQANEVEYSYTLVTNPDGSISSKVTEGEKKDAHNQPVTLLADKYDVQDQQSGRMVGFKYDSNKEEWTYTFSSAVGLYGVQNTPLTVTSFKSSTDFTDLYLQNVKVVYKNNNDKTVMGMFAEDSKVLFSGMVDSIDIANMKNDSVKIDGTSYDYGKKIDGVTAQKDTDVPVYEFLYDSNATAYAQATLNALTKPVSGPFEIQAIDYNDDGDINFFIIHPFSVAKVTNVGSKTFTAGNTYKFEDVTVYDGIAKDDYTMITAAKNTVDNTDVFEKVAEVSATANAVNKSGDVQFDTWYKLMAGVDAASAGTDYDYVAVNGYVFVLDGSSLGDAMDFVLVTAAADKTAGLDKTITAKVLKADGSETSVEVAKINNRAVNDTNVQPVVGNLYFFDQDDDDYYLLNSVNATTVKGATTNTTDTSASKTVDYDVVLTRPNANMDTMNTTNLAGTAVFNSPGGSDNKNYISYQGNNYYFDDDAKFFVFDGTDYSVISGAKMKTTAATPNVAFVAADKNSDTGFTNVVLAYVNNRDAISSGDTLYGYVTSDAVKKQADGSSTKYNVTLSFWDGQKDQELVTKDAASGTFINTAAALEAGDVFSYELNDENKIDKITFYGKAGFDANGASSYVVAGTNRDKLETAAITGYSAGDKLLTVSNDVFSEGTSTANPAGVKVVSGAVRAASDTLKITNDTVIIFVDSSDNTGSEGTTDSIQQCIKDTLKGVDGQGATIEYTANLANAMYINNVSNEVDLLIVDTANDIMGILA